MTAIILALPGNDRLANRIGAFLDLDVSDVVVHRFPDGEARVRVKRSVAGRAVILVAPLDRSDQKILPLLFAAATARDLGASSVGLVAPYLAYMRQDRRFEPGEGVSAVHFARLLSGTVDWLVTVDPHLHRTATLEDLYTIPAHAAATAPLLAEWVAMHVERPVIIGPDVESAQWVESVASRIKAPHAILTKRRSGDETVALKLADLSGCVGHQPVLVDDIIASGATMIEATGLLRRAGWPAPICLGVHAVFAGNAYALLQEAGAAKIVTCNTITHPSNEIDVSNLVAVAVEQSLQASGLSAPRLEAVR
ncbi:MAG: ribose-phosphate pyrophosphokinase [Gemmatimonadales bacterium]